jgi:hypothetical protein
MEMKQFRQSHPAERRGGRAGESSSRNHLTTEKSPWFNKWLAKMLLVFFHDRPVNFESEWTLCLFWQKRKGNMAGDSVRGQAPMEYAPFLPHWLLPRDPGEARFAY